MDDFQNYRSAGGPSTGESSYSSKLSGLRSSHTLLPSKPYPGTVPVRGYQDSRDPMGSVDSLLAGHISQNDITDDDSLNELTQRQSTRLQLLPNPVEHLNMKTRGIQLPVKHTNEIGTQIGILLPKYHIHPQSKCIMCRDCGIFFSHDSFLRHLHDNIGRRTDCQSTMLELGVENPGVQQMKLWDDFLGKLKGGESSHKRPRTSSYDSTAGTTDTSLRSNRYRSTPDSHSSSQQLQPRRPAMHYSPRTSMRGVQRSPPGTKGSHFPGNPSGNSPKSSVIAGAGSISDFNKNIQNTVDASERLLRETSQYLASTEKSQHRRNRSITMDLQTKPDAVDTKPHASRSLFSSDRTAPHLQNAPSENLSASLRLSVSEIPNGVSQNGCTEGNGTAHFPQDARMYAGGDLPSSTSNPHTRIPSQSNPNSIDAMRVASSVLPQDEARSRLRLPSTNGVLHGEQNNNKEDPLFILQTAQELLNLASHRIQVLKDEAAVGNGDPKSPGRDNEFLQLYHEERSKRRKFEVQLQELQDSLKEEQKQRKELEIQLRALKLQR